MSNIIYIDAYFYIQLKGYTLIEDELLIHEIDKYMNKDKYLIIGYLHSRDGLVFDIRERKEEL